MFNILSKFAVAIIFVTANFPTPADAMPSGILPKKSQIVRRIVIQVKIIPKVPTSDTFKK